MTPQQMCDKLTQLEKATLKRKDNDTKTKYQVVGMFRYLKKLVKYQIPTPPINVKEDGHQFECPQCHTIFDSEDRVDEFNLCYICGRRWKENEEEGTEE